ncbi:Stk1 family PASTA domain-containing Ser/Thr kinase [Lapidilactobacillus luobeiensis]|uniref:Stk1 family PASTA domain-containing Ser/Thr kinase n=1 Tax=Lapidilactobacillus luobeiensis TaxID=2950371 RepID=UPI0021C3E6C7|nr:Stk1 family PASTA domain-containing Ser/Thr kinase [Lapidilactobacillus luobeiensis]
MMERGYLVSGRYQIIDTLGEGGMANVYLAEDTFLHRQVAVKVLRMDLQHDQATIRRFQREAKATCELSHPNIVSVYDVGSDDGMQYIVMEYVKGEDLKAFIEQKFPLPLSEVLDMMDQILSAVQLAHSRGIIHRDLKPQNILVTPNGQVKIADFGIAVALNDQSATQTNSLLGSVHYISPEQARGGMATPRSDIYALGIILYELLTGKVPFAGDSAVTIALKHFHEEIPSMRALNDQIPQPLENVVLKATAKDPDQRYQSAHAMAQDLKTSLDIDRANEPKFVATSVDQDLAATKVLTDLPAATATSELATLQQDEAATPKPTASATAKAKKKRKWLPWVIAGAVVLVGLVIGLIILFGKHDVTVPDLAGMSQSEATSSLADHDLKVGELVYENSATIAKDLVIRSIPGKKSSVKADSTVKLVLSQGAKTYQVRDYHDLEYSEIKEKLTKAGFTVKRKNKSSSSIAAGRIIKQSITAGKKVVAKKSTITLTVSTGEPTFKLRDLSGYSKKNVQDYADDVGLNVTFVEEYSSTVESGVVIGTDPAKDTIVSSGATVTVKMSAGTDPTSVSSSSSSKNDSVKTIDKVIPITYLANNSDSSSTGSTTDDSSSSSSVAQNKITIYIGDENHNIETLYRTMMISTNTNITLSFTVKNGESAQYRILRDGELYASESVTQ